jgi:hypothetical protein
MMKASPGLYSRDNDGLNWTSIYDSDNKDPDDHYDRVEDTICVGGRPSDAEEAVEIPERDLRTPMGPAVLAMNLRKPPYTITKATKLPDYIDDLKAICYNVTTQYWPAAWPLTLSPLWRPE